MTNKTYKSIILRKILHLGTLLFFGVFWFIYGVTNNPYTANLFLLSVLVLFFLYEFLRLDLYVPVPFMNLIKPKESSTTVDGMNLIIAGIIVHATFPFHIALTAMLMGIVGDAVSTLGGLLGRYKIFPNSERKTTWEGALLTFMVNTIIGISVLGISWVVVIMALSAIIIETMVIRLDDNLVVPILTSLIALIYQNVF
jgi:dolichol kinase